MSYDYMENMVSDIRKWMEDNDWNGNACGLDDALWAAGGRGYDNPLLPAAVCY